MPSRLGTGKSLNFFLQCNHVKIHRGTGTFFLQIISYTSIVNLVIKIGIEPVLKLFRDFLYRTASKLFNKRTE